MSTPRRLRFGNLSASRMAMGVAALLCSSVSSTQAGSLFAGFGAPALIPTGNAPIAVALGDLDGDTVLDLVSANFQQGTVSIRFGLGVGTFISASEIPIGVFPVDLDLGDIDNDGDLDLVVTQDPIGSSQDGVVVLLNDGAGAFTFKLLCPVGSSPESVELVDLDNDGILDLVVGVFNDVAVIKGVGDGTFGVPMLQAAGVAFVVATAHDMNMDGFVDIVAASFSDNSVSLLINQGTGVFDAPVFFPAGESPRALAAADVNGDDLIDVAIAGDTPSSLGAIYLLLGNATTTFDPPVQLSTGGPLGSGVGPWDIALVDLNFDGSPDVISSNVATGDVTVLINNGAGVFDAPRFFPAGLSARSLAVGDINMDGSPDLVVASLPDNSVAMLLNLTANPLDLNGDGAINGGDLAILLAGWGATGPKLPADFNGDGIVDSIDLATLLASWTG
jgi:FG-GAP-like repeat/Dockerin type I domain